MKYRWIFFFSLLHLTFPANKFKEALRLNPLKARCQREDKAQNMKLNGSLLEKENCESQYLLVAMRCVLVPTNDLQLEVSNDGNWNIVIAIILMHLFLDGFYCRYSSCVCCPVCSSYSPVDPFINLGHIISLLCCSSCFLHCIEYFGMIDSNRRYRVRCILCAWNVKNSILPVTRLCLTVSECVHSKPLPSTLMPGPLVAVPMGKLINPKAVHLVSKIFSSVCVPISEMVVTKPVFNTPLELPNITAPIFACMNSTAMTLPIRPLPSINIASVKPVHPESVPKSLSILASIPASSRPSFDPIAIVLLINPIPFVSPTHVIVIHSTSRALPLVKLALVNVTVSINLNPTPTVRSLLGPGRPIAN